MAPDCAGSKYIRKLLVLGYFVAQNNMFLVARTTNGLLTPSTIRTREGRIGAVLFFANQRCNRNTCRLRVTCGRRHLQEVETCKYAYFGIKDGGRYVEGDGVRSGGSSCHHRIHLGKSSGKSSGKSFWGCQSFRGLVRGLPGAEGEDTEIDLKLMTYVDSYWIISCRIATRISARGHLLDGNF